MATRTAAQVLGSQGQSLVAHIINSNEHWVVRTQDEDFGVDLEAELTSPQVVGHLMKIQVKASRSLLVNSSGVVCKVPKGLLSYADSCRLPVVLVRVSLAEQKAWYLWLQDWLFEQRRRGRDFASLPSVCTLYIPIEKTLEAGLQGELCDVAQWRTKTQLALTVNDAISTSAVVGNYAVLNHLVALLDELGVTNEHFPVGQVVERAVSLGSQLWATQTGNQAASTLFAICHHYAERFSADQVVRMITRGESISRIGLNALGILYDSAYEHIKGMELQVLFLAHPDKRVAFYCHLRELHPTVPGFNCLLLSVGVHFAGLTITPELHDDLLGKWPNRGDSVILDYLQSTEGQQTIL